MNIMLYRRYWNRVAESRRMLRSGVASAWNLRSPRPGGSFIDYNITTVGTLPEKMIYAELEKRGVGFYYGYYFGDMPFTEHEEHYRPDFVLPAYNIILEIQGGYWHSRPGQWIHDYRRALWFAAAGYKLITLLDSDIYFDVAGAINQAAPELYRPAVGGGPMLISGLRPDPTASIKARLRKWPKVIRIRFRNTTPYRLRTASAIVYRAAASKIKRAYLQDFVFESSQMDPNLIEQYRQYGQQWRQYVESLGDFFERYPSLSGKYPTQYAYWTRWRNWWNRYGRS